MHCDLGRTLCSTALLACVVAGCDQPSKPAEPPAASPATTAKAAPAAVPPEVAAEAQQIFSSRCTPCHGPKGAGDGPASAGLVPRPRNFQDAQWQQATADSQLVTIIQYGGAAVGKSPAMPPNPDLVDKPVIQGLVQHLRGLKQAPSATAKP
jgi:mono/diheme cytochrome c family protein